MKHILSLVNRNIVAGAFLLLGFSANTQAVSAEVFILQGEPGKDGAQGPKGDKGDAGKDGLGFTQDTLDYVNSIKTVITVDTTTNTLELKPTSGNKFTLKVGNNTLDFDGDTITVNTQTFEAKGTNGTSLKLDDANKNVIVEKANFHIRNGSGQTDTKNGLGNLIVGYNKPLTTPPMNSRDGSHNVVVGDSNSYYSYGGFVLGEFNIIKGNYSSVSGGESNNANGNYSSVSGGQNNHANGNYSSVSGGQNNKAHGHHSSVSGGESGAAGTQGPQNASSPTHGYVCGGKNLSTEKKNGVACVHAP